MSVIADISPVVADDRLARKNALVLSVAQALAGGNNTVIAATAGIIGTMLATDKGLATLPVSMMVIGIWFGTLPLGWLARNYGRRFALQTGSVVGTLAGLISCAAVLMGSFELFLVGTFGCGFYAAAHNSYRFAVCDTASDAYKPKAISMVLAGGVMAGFIGSGTVIVTKDLWVPHLFAATFVGQAMLAALAGLVLTRLKSPPPVPREEREAGRPLSEIVQNPLFVVAVACGVVSYVVMNLLMTSAPIAMVELCHRTSDRPIRRVPDHLCGAWAAAAQRRGRRRGSFHHALLGQPDAPGHRMELRLHRSDHAGDPLSPPGRAQQGPVVQRFPDLRHDGAGLVRLGQADGDGGLGVGQYRRFRTGAAGGPAARLAEAAAPRASGLRRISLNLEPV
jgi:hypothetical protein